MLSKNVDKILQSMVKYKFNREKKREGSDFV
jgi:hypothetical protein